MENVKKHIRWVQWISLAGVLISLYLLLLHLQYERFGASCTIGERFSCSVLLIKKYSVWFSIPVPIYSALLYLVSFFLSRYAYKHHSKDLIKPHLYLFALSSVSLLATMGMGFVAFFVLKTICLFCSLLYLVSILYFIQMFKIFKTDYQPWFYFLLQERKHAFQNPTVLKTILGVFIVLFVAFFVFQREVSTPQASQSMSAGKVLGNPSAVVKVEVFSDFQCPACKTVTSFLYQIERELGHEVQIIHRSYPLDPSCNPSIRHNMHPEACNASVAAYCASVQGKFWRYHDLLFDYQHALSEQKYTELAESENLHIGSFLNCYQSADAQNAVLEDIEKGNQYQIKATPSILINGRMYEGARTVQAFKQAIGQM